MTPHIGGIISSTRQPLELGQWQVLAVMLVAVRASRTLQCVCTHGVTNPANSLEHRQVTLVKVQFNCVAAAIVQFACIHQKPG
jgi:hypothetical protein